MCPRSKNPVIYCEEKMNVGRLIQICYWSLKGWNSIIELDVVSAARLPWCQPNGGLAVRRVLRGGCAHLPSMPAPSVLIRQSDSPPCPPGPSPLGARPFGVHRTCSTLSLLFGYWDQNSHFWEDRTACAIWEHILEQKPLFYNMQHLKVLQNNVCESIGSFKHHYLLITW